MDEEVGIYADTLLVEKIADEISSKWKLSKKLPKNLQVLLVGGFQGAGKTTVLEILKKKIDLIIISPDEIRHNLFEKGRTVNDEFVRTVDATRNELLRKALQTGQHIAIDQLTTPARIELVRNIIKERKAKYKLLTVYLKASKNILIKRLEGRQQLPGTYKGTVNELKKSMFKHGEPDLGSYDLILDTEKLSPFETAKKLQGLVELIKT